MPGSASDPELCLASSEANITGGEFSVTPVLPRSRRLRPPTRSRRCAWLLVLSVFCPPVVAQEPVPAELQQFTEQLMQQEQAELAANDKIGGKWRGVSRIRGTATIIYRTTVEEADLMPSDVRSMTDETTVRFEMVRDDTHGEAGLQWRAHTISLVGGISEQSTFKTAGEDIHMTADGGFQGAAADPEEMDLALSTSDGRWELDTPPFTLESYVVTRQWNGQRFENFKWEAVNLTETEQKNSVQDAVFTGTIADQPGLTIGTFYDEDTVGGRSTRRYQKRARVEFWPEYDDYTLEVRIDDYVDWRPLGQIAEPGKPGNNLTAKATVLPKGDAAAPQVRAISFQLLDVSREPGVCLNWPLGAKDRDPDLRLAASPDNPGSLSQEDQRFEVTQPLVDNLRRPFALAQIDSYDFGARATLRVTAELLDGRELVGEFVAADGEAAQDLIRLPNMAGPDWIAAAWKRENGVTALPDTDDSEKVDGQVYDGDGFTLYEEYRGWMEGGKRIEGDPKRKDFFVLNLIGADARKGIELFEKVSELQVHSKLRRSEMSQKTRLMNGNHRDAPQRVKQHGVWVKAFGSAKELGVTGAATPMTKAGVSGRPGITVGVGILARDNADSAFNKPYNLPKHFSLLAYDRAIAHELLHSVGVEHHGTADRSLAARWISPRNRRNALGRPYFRELMSDTPLTLLDETGHDLAAQIMAEQYAVWYEKFKYDPAYKIMFWDRWIAEGKAYIAAREGYGLELDTPEKYAEDQLEQSIGPTFYGIVGKPHGEHSGHQDCLMRYYFAEFYPARGREDTYYQVTPGTEPYGLQLCRAKEGTGVNASSFKPQSRYGDAGPHGGNCFSQITPNDAIPPGKTQ